MTFQYFLQLMISGLVIGSIYSAVALGFVIIYKATRVVNFAQGELLMVGAYVCYAFLVQMHVPFWAALLLTVLFGMVLAMFVERLILRPMIGEPAISIIMVTIGLSLVLRSVASAIWGTDILVFPPGDDLVRGCPGFARVRLVLCPVGFPAGRILRIFQVFQGGSGDEGHRFQPAGSAVHGDLGEAHLRPVLGDIFQPGQRT